MIARLKRLRARRKKATKEGTETVLVRWGFCWRSERRAKEEEK